MNPQKLPQEEEKIRKRLTKEQAIKLIKEKVDLNDLGTFHIRVILNEVIPFSWHVYCRENKLNPNILMDEHEKRLRKDRKLRGSKR